MVAVTRDSFPDAAVLYDEGVVVVDVVEDVRKVDRQFIVVFTSIDVGQQLEQFGRVVHRGDGDREDIVHPLAAGVARNGDGSRSRGVGLETQGEEVA